MHTLSTVGKAAVRNSRLTHLLTCRLRLIWLSAMTHAVIISSGEDLFFLFCAFICWIHVRDLQLKLRLISSSQVFSAFQDKQSFTKLSVKVICVPFLRSACRTCPPICCVMRCCCNFYNHVTSFLCDLKKIPPVLRASRSMFMLKCSWMWYLRKGWWGGKKEEFKGEFRNFISLNGFLIHHYPMFLSKTINLMLKEKYVSTKSYNLKLLDSCWLL